MKRTSPQGFSLSELVIVIMLGGLLLAIAFPAFAKLRQSGHRTTCVSNLRTIGTAVQQYAADNNGRFPLSRLNYTMDESGNRKTVSFLPDLLNRLYLKQPEVERLWWCPADKARPEAMRKHSYGHNQRLGGEKGVVTTWDGKPNPDYDSRYAGFHGVQKPLSELIMLIEFEDRGDAKWSSVVTGTRWPMGRTSDPSQTPAARVDFLRHPDVANALMCDGSVRGFRLADLLHTENRYILPEE